MFDERIQKASVMLSASSWNFSLPSRKAFSISLRPVMLTCMTTAPTRRLSRTAVTVRWNQRCSAGEWHG